MLYITYYSKVHCQRLQCIYPSGLSVHKLPACQEPGKSHASEKVQFFDTLMLHRARAVKMVE